MYLRSPYHQMLQAETTGLTWFGIVQGRHNVQFAPSLRTQLRFGTSVHDIDQSGMVEWQVRVVRATLGLDAISFNALAIPWVSSCSKRNGLQEAGSR
jgi:hypothetical protein